MIPTFGTRTAGALLLVATAACSPRGAAQVAVPAASAVNKAVTANCLSTGDGYLHATIAGAVETKLDWPNSGTHCEGESRDTPPGVRLSFQRDGSNPNLLLIFGLSGVKQGEAAHAVGANLTVIVQGTDQIYGTLGDARCTVDSLTQQPLKTPGAYRVEARGFCTQPAHAVRGAGDVLVSTFEFAGPVKFLTEDEKANPKFTAGQGT